MRTTLIMLTSTLSLALGGCGDDGGAMDDSTTAATNDGSTTGGTGTPETTETGDPPVGSTDDGMMDGTTAAVPALECAEYCGIYMEACVDFTEYANDQECMDQCGQWPVGAAEDVGGDSLGCRTYHATVASSADPDVHCPHAGPSGAMTCTAADAPTCADYCDTYFDSCTDDLNVYVDMDDCLAQCAPWYPGTVGDVAGNTIGCRTYHAGAPAVGDPDLHCPHAAPGGADVCVFE